MSISRTTTARSLCILDSPSAYIKKMRKFEMAQDKQQGSMSVNEAGKKGGDATSASHDKEFYQEIGSKGGQNSGGNFKNDPERASEAGSKGGQNSGGNFANDRDRASEAGSKGGQSSGGNFANDREKASEAGHKGGQNSHGGGRNS
jgi:general stress protein YciG